MPSLAKLVRSLGARSRARRMKNAPFYVTYPYRHELPLTVCDARGAVDVERRFFFNRVPKCANSTVVVKLAALKSNDALPAREAKRAFARPSELTAQEVAAFPGFFKFTVVRNPYTRALSAYLNKIVRGRKLDYLRRAGIDAAAPSFLDFCTYLDRGGLHQNAHWAPQASLMLIPVEQFDRVGHVETLHDDLQAVFARLAPGRALNSTERHGPPPTRAESQLDAHYDDACAAIIARLYQRDFETFGYSPRLSDAAAAG